MKIGLTVASPLLVGLGIRDADAARQTADMAVNDLPVGDQDIHVVAEFGAPEPSPPGSLSGMLSDQRPGNVADRRLFRERAWA